MADSLYGVKQASKTKAKEISSSTSLAFSSNLASLISSSTGKSASTGARPRPSKTKPDIFTAHNKNVKKRAAADMLDDGTGEQRHQTRDDIGGVDSVELARSRRRMEEKAKIYSAMKRGDYRARADGDSDRGLVDFDRKWAETQARGSRDYDSNSSDEDEDENTLPADSEMVEYVDEFGRLRKGTKQQAEKEERRKRVQEIAMEEAQEFAARPAAPTNVIYGDTVQHQAFNPDQVITDRMAEIAKKRDKSATPPPDAHFDASAEVRTKGTGFYTFSHDAEVRRQQMAALEKERLETESIRRDHEEKKQQRKIDLENRKTAIAQQKGRALAEKFLNDLDLDLPSR